MMDLGIADRLRFGGLTVVEVAGWQTRGRPGAFNPAGSVNHHTAGAAVGNSPSLATVIYGRPGLAGPLANVFQARDNTVYVVAAGRANHAGRGGWAGLRGNSTVYGLEVENVGTTAEPWRPDQVEVMHKVHALLVAPVGADAGRVCQHKEWAPGRKIDAHSLNGDRFRAAVGVYLAPVDGSEPAPPELPDHPAGNAWLAEVLRIIADVSTRTQYPGDRGHDVKVLQRVLNHKAGGLNGVPLEPDGIYGPKTEAAVRNVQAWTGQAVDGIAGPNTWHALKQ
ncbi:MAG: peptidoglycan-binding protein [Phycisphaerales bacterium]